MVHVHTSILQQNKRKTSKTGDFSPIFQRDHAVYDSVCGTRIPRRKVFCRRKHLGSQHAGLYLSIFVCCPLPSISPRDHFANIFGKDTHYSWTSTFGIREASHHICFLDSLVKLFPMGPSRLQFPKSATPGSPHAKRTASFSKPCSPCILQALGRRKDETAID